MDTGESRVEEARRLAKGASVVYETLAEVLLNEPSLNVLNDVRQVAAALGQEGLEDFEPSDSLTQRYYDRLFNPAHCRYVPLFESSIRNALQQPDGTWVFGALGDAHTDHVEGCYRAVGFDFRTLKGFDLAIRSARADSLACELAFMALLARRESEVSDAWQARHLCNLQRDFLHRHLGCWTKKASQAMAAAGDDFYARVCQLTASWVDADCGRISA